METRVINFSIRGGGKARLGDVAGDDLWVLVISGALFTLGCRNSWSMTVTPLPHAWRIIFTKGDVTVWFDVDEADAMQIESFAGDQF